MKKKTFLVSAFIKPKRLHKRFELYLCVGATLFRSLFFFSFIVLALNLEKKCCLSTFFFLPCSSFELYVIYFIKISLFLFTFRFVCNACEGKLCSLVFVSLCHVKQKNWRKLQISSCFAAKGLKRKSLFHRKKIRWRRKIDYFKRITISTRMLFLFCLTSLGKRIQFLRNSRIQISSALN